MTNTNPPMKTAAYAASLKKLWDAVGEKKLLLFATLFVGFLDMLVDSLGLSWSIRTVSNAALSRDMDAVFRSVRFLAFVVVSRASLASLGGYMAAKVTEDTALNLRTRLFRSIMGGRTEYFDTHESGDLISRLNNDVETAKMGITAFVNGAKQLFLIVFAITGLLVWSWPFAVGLLVMAGLSFLGGASTSRPLRVTGQRYQETLARVSESATNLFGGVAVIKSLKAEREMGARFGFVTDEHRKVAKKRGFYMALQMGTVMAVPYLGLGGGMLLAGSMVFRGLLTPGDAIGVVQLSSRALFPFSQLGGIWAGIQQNLAALDRIEEACAIPQERAELGDAVREAAGVAGTHDVAAVRFDREESTAASPAVEFRDVHFAYGTQPVLEGLSFRVGRGESAALVGPSGSGKSTILRLILGMYEPGAGTVLVDGRSVSESSLSALRNMTAVVPQEPWLIPGTIKENIVLGKPGASDDEIAGAAALANAAEFIDQLPGRYDTVLDERGSNLSGGQRQRICLARAFLKDAPILLLDEPTSAVDSESERLIRQAVDTLAQGRTVITVAHTEAMVDNASVRVTLSAS